MVQLKNKDQEVFRFKELPIDEKPRERLIKYGVSTLSHSELIAIILSTGTQRQNVLDLAKQLLVNYNLKSLSQLSTSELKKVLGIGKAKACQIVAVFELGRRVASYSNSEKILMNKCQLVANYFAPKMQNLKQEVFQCAYLNTRKRLLKTQVISVGSLNANNVEPREVFREGISEAADSVILIHNHPSGDPTPSPQDIEITKKLIKAGEIIGIKVLDHIIIGDGKWVSLKEKNLI